MKIKFKPPAVIAGALLICSGAESSLHIPAGFEELAQGQVILTEVSVYGRSLGVFRSQVDLEGVRFLQPAELASAIKNAYPNSSVPDDLLHNKLNSRFQRNGNLSCSTNGGAPGCDYLKTDSIAIIYDENNARINLFLAGQYLPQDRVRNIYYEPSAESRNAFVHQQNINFVADRNYQSASVQGNGSLGVTDSGYLNVDWNWQGQRSRTDSIQQTDINNAYFRQDLMRRFYLQAGVMDARDIFSNAGGSINLSQLPLGKIRGARAGSTLAWINMDKMSGGTPVSVFLSRDSRVDAYRGNQLLASFYLKAGAQELDSRSFPAGSYTVTLRIYEDNQLVRTETTPYTGLGGSSVNVLQWFLQAGVPDDDTQQHTGDDRRVIQAGLRVPLTQNTSLTTGAARFTSVHYWESAIDWSHGFDSGWIDGLMTMRASYLHGSEGSRGNMQQLNYNDGFSLSFYRSSMTASDCNSQNIHSYSFNGCYKSTNIMLSVPFSQWYGSLGYALNSNEGRYVYRRDLPEDDPGYQAGIPWEKVYRTHTRSHTWQAGLTRAFSIGNVNLSTSANVFMRDESAFNGTDKGGFLTFSLSRSQNQADGKRSSSSAGASWQTSKRGNNQLGYNAAYSQYADDRGENEMGASLYGINSDTVTSSVYGRAGGQYGSGAVTISDAWERTAKGRHTLSSSGNYSSSLIVDRTNVLLGRWGDGTPSSAVTIGVEQDDDQRKSQVSVSLDSGGRSDVRGGSQALFTVPGYRETTFSVTESRSSTDGISGEISKGTGTRSVYMTPGKVFNRNVAVNTRYTWLGRLTDEHRMPLEGGIPLNVMSWTSPGKGAFTMETSKKMKTLYVMKDNAFWQCDLKVSVIRDVIRYVGTTVCRSTGMASLPGAERKQVELMTAGAGREVRSTAMNE